MSGIEEIGEKKNSTNRAYAMLQAMRDNHQAMRTNVNDGTKLVDSDDINSNEQIDPSSAVDGKRGVDPLSYIASNTGSDTDSGTDSGGSNTEDTVSAIKSMKSDIDPTMLSFNPALRRIATRLNTLGVQITEHIKTALQNLEENDPAALKNLSLKMQNLDRKQVQEQLKNL